MKKVWLITGCSAGFGRELAKVAIAHDYQVAVTARDENASLRIVRNNLMTTLVNNPKIRLGVR